MRKKESILFMLLSLLLTGTESERDICRWIPFLCKDIYQMRTENNEFKVGKELNNPEDAEIIRGGWCRELN